MKLPLHVHRDRYGMVMIYDASSLVVFTQRETPYTVKFAYDLVRRMNKHWRWRFLRQQPYEYTREDWLFERNTVHF